MSSDMSAIARPINPIVVSHHLEDAASLRAVREVLVTAPHVKLLHLARIDERRFTQALGFVYDHG